MFETLKTLFNPTTFKWAHGGKECVEAAQEWLKDDPEVDKAVESLLVVLRKRCDDQAEAAEAIFDLAGPMVPPTATKEETRDAVLIQATAAKVTAKLFK